MKNIFLIILIFFNLITNAQIEISLKPLLSSYGFNIGTPNALPTNPCIDNFLYNIAWNNNTNQGTLTLNIDISYSNTSTGPFSLLQSVTEVVSVPNIPRGDFFIQTLSGLNLTENGFYRLQLVSANYDGIGLSINPGLIGIPLINTGMNSVGAPIMEYEVKHLIGSMTNNNSYFRNPNGVIFNPNNIIKHSFCINDLSSGFGFSDIDAHNFLLNGGSPSAMNFEFIIQDEMGNILSTEDITSSFVAQGCMFQNFSTDAPQTFNEINNLLMSGGNGVNFNLIYKINYPLCANSLPYEREFKLRVVNSKDLNTNFEFTFDDQNFKLGKIQQSTQSSTTEYVGIPSTLHYVKMNYTQDIPDNFVAKLYLSNAAGQKLGIPIFESDNLTPNPNGIIHLQHITGIQGDLHSFILYYDCSSLANSLAFKHLVLEMDFYDNCTSSIQSSMLHFIPYFSYNKACFNPNASISPIFNVRDEVFTNVDIATASNAAYSSINGTSVTLAPSSFNTPYRIGRNSAQVFIDKYTLDDATFLGLNLHKIDPLDPNFWEDIYYNSNIDILNAGATTTNPFVDPERFAIFELNKLPLPINPIFPGYNDNLSYDNQTEKTGYFKVISNITGGYQFGIGVGVFNKNHNMFTFNPSTAFEKYIDFSCVYSGPAGGPINKSIRSDSKVNNLKVLNKKDEILLTTDINKNEVVFEYSLVNMIGQQIINDSKKNNIGVYHYQISKNSLPHGVYFLNTSLNGNFQSHKILVD